MNYILLVLIFVVGFWYLCLRRHGRGSRKILKRKEGEYDFSYQARVVKIPPLRGFGLKLAVRLLNSWFGEVFLAEQGVREGWCDHFRVIQFEEKPTFYPNVPLREGEKCAEVGEDCASRDEFENLLKNDFDQDAAFQFNSVIDFVAQYKSGKTTPSQVAESSLRAIEKTKRLNAVIKYDPEEVRKMAAASTQRYKNNETLSPVDGIVVVIKDEYAVEGFQYSNGTTFIGAGSVAEEDSDVVAKLRSLGCIIVAVANMHELGFGTSGNNTNNGFGACRNPYNPDHITGGSSSGCGASVASGIATMGLGTDGGGSIRMPAAFCGLVGLKPTFARINLSGVHGLSYSVGHCGPLCVSVRDASLFYALLSGPHPGYSAGLVQPVVKLPTFDRNLKGMKIGVDWRYFKDCTAEMWKVCEKSLAHLQYFGATIKDIELPEVLDVIHAHRITIMSEMSSSLIDGFEYNYDDLNLGTRNLFRLGHQLRAIDFIQANRQRTRIMTFLAELFKDVDVIVTPSTGHCAPELLDSEIGGASNSKQDLVNMRYAPIGNFTGIPAITVPVGYNDLNLPVGLQIMSSWWREDVILKVAECVECRIKKQVPQVYVDLLDN